MTIDPSVADHHYLLGNFYGFQNDYVNALRSIERALEIEPNTAWLYSKASAIRQQDRHNTDDVISTYEVENFVVS